MRLQFKHQKFQADAAKAVVDVFAGQPFLTPSYMMDRGSGYVVANSFRLGWMLSRAGSKRKESDAIVGILINLITIVYLFSTGRKRG